MKPAHRLGDYPRQAKAVRLAATLNPDTRCWRCGSTYLEYATIHGERAARWQAGHVVDGAVGGELQAEHWRCNSQAGAIYGNRRRNPTSEDW